MKTGLVVLVVVVVVGCMGLPHIPPQCSNDAKHLSLLVSNVSAQAQDLLSDSHRDLEEFTKLVTSSLTQLSTQTEKVTQMIRVKDNTIKKLILSIADTQASLQKTRHEITEVELASKDLESECRRAEDLHKAQESEQEEVLRLVRSVNEIVTTQWSHNPESTQMLLSSVVSVLPGMVTGSRTSKHATDEIQNLIQSDLKTADGATPQEELVATLESLINETLKEIETGRENLETKRQMCTFTAQSLREQNIKLSTKATETASRIDELTTQREVREEELALMQSRLPSLAAANADKKRILLEANVALSIQKKSLSEQIGFIEGILKEDMCCMCNNQH